MLKKIALFTALLVGAAGVSQAWDFEKNPDRNNYVKYTQSITATLYSTSAVIVDLSDTTTWPHKEEGEVRVSWLRVSMDKAAASTETVKVGVVTELDASDGSVEWFYSLSSRLNVSNTNVVDVIDLQPSWVSLKAIKATGATPYLLSNDTTSGSTDYQNDVVIPSASGTDVAPAVGDVIVFLENGTAGANDIIFTVELIYHTIKR